MAGHYSKHTGTEVCRLLISFNSGHYKAIGLGSYLAGNPPNASSLASTWPSTWTSRFKDVAAVRARLQQELGLAHERIQVKSSDLFSKILGSSASDQHVTLDCSRPGKPTNNPHIPSFNGSFRSECLHVHWFLSLADVWEKI